MDDGWIAIRVAGEGHLFVPQQTSDSGCVGRSLPKRSAELIAGKADVGVGAAVHARDRVCAAVRNVVGKASHEPKHWVADQAEDWEHGKGCDSSERLTRI